MRFRKSMKDEGRISVSNGIPRDTVDTPLSVEK